MSNDTDYKRLWRRDHDAFVKVEGQLRDCIERNKVLIGIMQKIRDGKIEVSKIFEDKEMPERDKSAEFIRQTAKKYREKEEKKNG